MTSRHFHGLLIMPVWFEYQFFASPQLKVRYILEKKKSVLLSLVSHQEEKALCTFLVLICG
jgi:hypothetical protein